MSCELCPRKCGADRENTVGFCGMGNTPVAAKAMLHFWEEPCIAGTGGAGAVFFSGCNLGCVYCQNREISRGGFGVPITEERLAEIFDELVWQGADVIDLVTPTHFADVIARVLRKKKPPVPVVYNCGGYERVETLRLLEGLIDVYLPDFKYADPALAKRLSGAPDYPKTALAAIREMHRQTGDWKLDDAGILTSGVLVRHLVLPGHVKHTLDCIDLLTGCFTQDNILLSVMSQYTPPPVPLGDPDLDRRLTPEEYAEVTDYLYLLGLDNVYLQELSSAKEEYTPAFDLGGLCPPERRE